jgi:hypothetical protein
MIAGVLVIALGFVPLLFGHFTFSSLESAGSFFAIGILIFIVGWLLRKIRRSFE